MGGYRYQPRVYDRPNYGHGLTDDQKAILIEVALHKLPRYRQYLKTIAYNHHITYQALYYLRQHAEAQTFMEGVLAGAIYAEKTFLRLADEWHTDKNHDDKPGS